MTELRTLSAQAIPDAIERAKHYRLLNEPDQAESICHDILAVDGDHQEVLVILLLSLTDQFATGGASAVSQAKSVCARFTDEYQKTYYSGLINERDAKAMLGKRGQQFRFVAYDRIQAALEHYGKAIEIHPPNNDDAILRWNACLRMIERNQLTAPDQSERDAMELE